MQAKWLTAVAALALVAAPMSADARGAVRGAHKNAEGGVTAAAGVRGNMGSRGHYVETDGQRNGKGASGGCAQGERGSACRASAAQKNADGSASREGGAEVRGADGGTGSTRGASQKNADGSASGGRTTTASGANGSYNSTTSGQRAADGTASGSRSTQANGANGAYKADTTVGSGGAIDRTATANNANGSATATTSGNKQDGYNRSVTCKDASGATVACPK